MPGLLDTLEELFGTRDLYAVLDVEKGVGEGKIKKAYHKTSLKVHPDRAKPEDREEATKKFQALGGVYKILSDKDARALYDESGEVNDEGDAANMDDRNWDEHWRVLFNKVTLDDIKNFEEKYKNSTEEEQDLKKAYLDEEGDMDKIIDTVLCATQDDEPRFAEKIQGWIESEDPALKVPAFEKFSQETKENKSKRKKRRDGEAKEADEYAKELGLDDSENSLANMIMQRQAKREAEADSFFDHLAAKYGGGGSTKKGSPSKKTKKGSKKK